MKEKVVVGMSGGVDSSVAAYLLKQQGYEVIGVTMQIWQDEDLDALEDNGGCCGLSAVLDARSVADKLDIPYYVMNFKRDFKKTVIDYFVNEYFSGRTPNPCIACNRHVKWESLLQRSLQLGAKYIATGHYAKVIQLSNGRYTLGTAATQSKDQTYALYNLTQDQLKHTLMPVGDYTKEEIRDIAKDIGLSIFDKPDSQEICFIPDNDYGSFLKDIKDISTGSFVDVNGNILGQHKGIIYYTVGQRKGLGVTFGKPMYVKRILPSRNEVVLADDEDLFEYSLIADDINFMSMESLVGELEVMAKIRYSHKKSKAVIKMENGRISCTFQDKQRAITPGQAAVFYKDDYIVGGGTIL